MSTTLLRAAMCLLVAAAVPIAVDRTVERLDDQQWRRVKVRVLEDVEGFVASDALPELSE